MGLGGGGRRVLEPEPAAYEGDAVGLLAAPGTATTFAADVELVSGFSNGTVGGTVDAFRSLAGAPLRP